jgi:hypothetical protein
VQKNGTTCRLATLGLNAPVNTAKLLRHTMRGKLATDICIRRKADGMFLFTKSGSSEPAESQTPKFLSSVSKAKLSVRADMGLDLSEVEFISRAEIEAHHEQ